MKSKITKLPDTDTEQIERHIHRTNLQRLAHTLCLVLPIAAAFAGYFISSYFLNKNNITNHQELIKFLSSLGLYAVTSVFIFILTRSTNPIINIKITQKK